MRYRILLLRSAFLLEIRFNNWRAVINYILLYLSNHCTQSTIFCPRWAGFNSARLQDRKKYLNNEAVVMKWWMMLFCNGGRGLSGRDAMKVKRARGPRGRSTRHAPASSDGPSRCSCCFVVTISVRLAKCPGLNSSARSYTQ